MFSYNGACCRGTALSSRGCLPVSVVGNAQLFRGDSAEDEQRRLLAVVPQGPNGEPIHNRTGDAEIMDLPIVEHAEQKRPSLKASAVSELVKASSGQEQALYVLLAATGMRVSEALAVETRHFTNNGRTITVEQQVEKDSARVVKYLKTAAAKRQVDLHPDIAEYLQRFTAGKTGLLFHTASGTPHLYGNL